eukprot:7362167-Alexandrium_andersonii.AAC.1
MGDKATHPARPARARSRPESSAPGCHQDAPRPQVAAEGTSARQDQPHASEGGATPKAETTVGDHGAHAAPALRRSNEKGRHKGLKAAARAPTGIIHERVAGATGRVTFSPVADAAAARVA